MSLAVARAQKFGRQGPPNGCSGKKLRADDKGSVKAHDPLHLHKQELAMQRTWIEKRAEEYKSRDVAVSCWDPLNKILGWNRAMFKLLGFSAARQASLNRASSFEEESELQGGPREEEQAADLEIAPGGDVESITNLLTAATRQHFLTVGEQAVRESVPFECLHEMYHKNERGSYTTDMVLSYAKNVGNGLWISTMQIVSRVMIEALRNELLINMTVKANDDRKSYEQFIVCKEELALVLELAMKNMAKGTCVRHDDDGEELLSDAKYVDEESDEDWDDQAQGAIIPQKADMTETMYKSTLLKSYKVHFPTAANVVVEMVQQR